MSLMTRLRLSGESSLEEGTPDEVIAKKRSVLAEQVRPARLEAARHNPKWTEIQNDLVPRARGWLVSASTDAIYQPARGVVFQRTRSPRLPTRLSCRSTSRTGTSSSSRSSLERGPSTSSAEPHETLRRPLRNLDVCGWSSDRIRSTVGRPHRPDRRAAART